MIDGQRVALVTGASSGIGRQVARALAIAGWRVIGTGRDEDRMAAAKAQIDAVSTGGPVEMIRADLSLMASAQELARDVLARTGRLHLLVNNAGGMASELAMTSEGLEANFAGNHLGPFLLTGLLLPLMEATAATAPTGAVRILNTASDASEMVPGFNLDDMQNLANYSVGLAYCTGKLANILHVRALADRVGGRGILAHAVHPGAVDSNFFSYASPESQARYRDIDKATEEEGADTLIWLATAEEGAAVNGGYWHRRAPRTPHAVVEDAAVRERFWQESEKLVAGALGR